MTATSETSLKSHCAYLKHKTKTYGGNEGTSPRITNLGTTAVGDQVLNSCPDLSDLSPILPGSEGIILSRYGRGGR
jgi:hypothetical protein